LRSVIIKDTITDRNFNTRDWDWQYDSQNVRKSVSRIAILIYNNTRFEINCKIIVSCISLIKPLIKYIKIRIWDAEFSERLTSNKNLSKQTYWFLQLRNNCSYLQFSHKVNKPEDFDIYIQYTKERHRKQKPPNNTIVAVSNSVINMVPDRLPNIITQSNINLSLHSVPEVSDTNRYSTVDSIQKLKNIIANYKFNKEIRR